MANTEKKIAFATVDIGTSQIKLGVYCPLISPTMIVLNSIENELVYGSSGEVTSDYNIVHNACSTLFRELGSFLKKSNIQKVYLGICGHVSSLIEWDKVSGTAPAAPFRTWLDTTSYDCLEEYNQVMGNGRSKQIIGTFLPSGTNWLFTKLLHRKKNGFDANKIFLQVGDALFYELCGQYHTHFSSQISMVNIHDQHYAPHLLAHLDLPEGSLPAIQYESVPVTSEQKRKFDLPAESFVFPAMADLYTSLYGLRLNDHEGFMLANTSEQAGAFYLRQAKTLSNFLSIPFNDGFVNYGSTNTGGNVLSWFLTNVLNREITKDLLHELTEKARTIAPSHTPIILPYLQGERAPLWNPALTASMFELKSSHNEVHLFRAILESIAFARRQCFEQLGMDNLHLIKIAGGSSKNALWNSIRATVLDKRLAVADEKELAITGIVDYMIQKTESDYKKPTINFSIVEPDTDLIGIYDERYKKFMRYLNRDLLD